MHQAHLHDGIQRQHVRVRCACGMHAAATEHLVLEQRCHAPTVKDFDGHITSAIHVFNLVAQQCRGGWLTQMLEPPRR